MRRVAIVLALVALAALTLGAHGTQGGWAVAKVTNSPTSAKTSGLAFTHSNPACSGTGPTSTIDCLGSFAPTNAATTTAQVTSDTLTNNSSVKPGSTFTEQVGVESCNVSAQNNVKTAAGPMLPRYSPTFQVTGPFGGTNAMRLGGAPAYISSLLATAQPNPVISLGSTYGLGIWFKISGSTGGPLFSIGTTPTSSPASDNRILYVKPNGTVSFIQNSGGTSTTTTRTYNDGNWHFAYVTMSAVSIVVGVVSTTTLYVDGDPAVTGGGLLAGYNSDNGYWRLGYADPSRTAPTTPGFLNGEVSNFVVFNTANAPAAPTTSQRASQTQFDSWAASATSHWRLGDARTNPYTGNVAYLTGNDPCAMDTLQWNLGGTTTAVNTLAGQEGQWLPATPAAAPAAGANQTITHSYARVGSGYDADQPGLNLVATLRHRVQLVGATNWSMVFRWPQTVFVG